MAAYLTLVRSTMFYTSESWVPTAVDLQGMQRNDKMIKWICNDSTDSENIWSVYLEVEETTI